MLLILALAALSAPQELRTPQPAVAECFVLESSTRECLGWVRFLERPAVDGRTLEAEWAFLRPNRSPWQVRHVEELRSSGSRLVWREYSEQAGRTLLLDCKERAQDWTLESILRDDRERRQLSTAGGALLPLALLDLCRDGQLAAARVRVFEPLEAGFVERTVTTRISLEPLGTRLVEWQRSDGGSAVHWCFEGRSLVSFRIGPALVGRRISDAEWQRALESAHQPLAAASSR